MERLLNNACGPFSVKEGLQVQKDMKINEAKQNRKAFIQSKCGKRKY